MRNVFKIGGFSSFLFPTFNTIHKNLSVKKFKNGRLDCRCLLAIHVHPPPGLALKFAVPEARIKCEAPSSNFFLYYSILTLKICVKYKVT